MPIPSNLVPPILPSNLQGQDIHSSSHHLLKGTLFSQLELTLLSPLEPILLSLLKRTLRNLLEPILLHNQRGRTLRSQWEPILQRSQLMEDTQLPLSRDLLSLHP